MEDREVVEWLEVANKTLLPTQEESGTEVLFSPGKDCLNALLAQINNARSRLDICVFTITDDRISRAIMNAHKRKVSVHIITDDQKSMDLGSDIESLSRGGIPVRMDDSEAHMHNKFLIVDQKKLVTGSFNWTRSATSFNQENILITDDKDAVKAYQKEFKKLWDKMGDY